MPLVTIVSMKGMFFRSVRRRGVSVWPVYIVKIFNKCFWGVFASDGTSRHRPSFSGFLRCLILF